MSLFLIRHGSTKGNEEKRYVGSLDEPLSEKGIRELEQRWEKGDYPAVDVIFCSPLGRAKETAAIIYPGQDITIVEDLREMDFGRYEGRRFDELTDDEAYRSWLDSGGKSPFPDGEPEEAFMQRVSKVYRRIAEEAKGRRAAVITHGGVIMALLSRLYHEDGLHYEYRIGNGDLIEL